MKKSYSRLAASFGAAAFVLIALIVNISAQSALAGNTIYPPSLKPGDKIAILAPAGPMKNAPVDSAAKVLDSLGYQAVVMPHTYGKNGHFSGTTDERFADLKAAFEDTTVRAILCARGGYGVVHNLDRLAQLPLRDDPKWVIGFSDISALHALMASKNIASIHASMAKQVALGPDDPDNAVLFGILKGEMPSYTFAPDSLNHLGKASGKLLGGNLAVIADLIATPFDMFEPNTILFIEDVSEPIYKIERILYQLRLMGVFDKINGLIIGQFTDYHPDDNHATMEQMIADALEPYPDLPVAFNIPVGHVDHNVPLVESSQATLNVTPEYVSLTLSR